LINDIRIYYYALTFSLNGGMEMKIDKRDSASGSVEEPVNRRKWHHIFKFRGHKTVSNEI
jgi:hypothetical protein